MKRTLLVLLLAIVLLPASCQAENSAVLVIVDGLGSSYIYPDRSPACIDGSPLPFVNLDIVRNASARYDLWVPVPETESGNAVIATGYSGATGEMLSYYCATVYDALRAGGYLSMAIMETGDTKSMIAEPDISLSEQNNSIYSPDAIITVNSKSVPAGVQDILAACPPLRQDAGTDPAVAYRQYDDWSLGRGTAIVEFLGKSCPGLKYLLVVNVAGTDMAAQGRGFEYYRRAIEDLGPGLFSLEAACQATGTVMLVTADHGMSFKSADAKGSHASGEASETNESRLVPLLVFTGRPGNGTGLYGQECLAPTLLSLMGCPDSLSIEDGEPVPGFDPGHAPAKVAVAAPQVANWIPYVLIAALSVAGLVVALYLLKHR